MVVAAAAGIPVKVEVDAAWCIHKALRPRGSRLAGVRLAKRRVAQVAEHLRCGPNALPANGG